MHYIGNYLASIWDSFERLLPRAFKNLLIDHDYWMEGRGEQKNSRRPRLL